MRFRDTITNTVMPDHHHSAWKYALAGVPIGLFSTITYAPTIVRLIQVAGPTWSLVGLVSGIAIGAAIVRVVWYTTIEGVRQ